jgi:hypothetical protein
MLQASLAPRLRRAGREIGWQWNIAVSSAITIATRWD